MEHERETNCHYCKKEFVPSGPDQVYCTKKCRKKFNYEQQKLLALCPRCNTGKPLEGFTYCPGCIAERRFHRYGISKQHYDDLYAIQEGLCAICRKPETVKNRSLAVDHDHETGKIRGLLCYSCNVKLGWYDLFKFEIKWYLND